MSTKQVVSYAPLTTNAIEALDADHHVLQVALSTFFEAVTRLGRPQVSMEGAGYVHQVVI